MSYYDDNYNEKHNFTFRFDSNDGERQLEMNCNELYLGDIFARFKEFLQGCGYEIHGEIEVVEYNSEEDYDSGYTLKEPPKHEPKWDFSNIPNNNWPFGSLKSEPLPALTTVDISSLSSTDYSKVNQFPTMSPLTTEQVQSWSTEMPGTLGSAKYTWSDKDAY